MPDMLQEKIQLGIIAHMSSSFIERGSVTHKAPTRNRASISHTTEPANDDRNANMHPKNSEVCITLRRPQVSARKPHKCALITMPRNAIELSSPCSTAVNCNSHCAYGMIMLTFIFSMPMPNRLKPAASMMNTWNFPCSAVERHQHEYWDDRKKNWLIDSNVS